MIIKSLLDQDFYKFSMGQVALHQFPWVNVKYEFKCRNSITFTNDHLCRLKEEVKSFCNLQLTKYELEYLSSIRFFKKSYIDFLKLYKPDIDHVDIQLVDDDLQIHIEGPWFLTIYFEVPLLAMISQIYYECNGIKLNVRDGTKILNEKIDIADKEGFPFVDFGTRRRFSHTWHEMVINTLKDVKGFKGTSNVLFAKDYDLTPIGTMAHEIFMVGQSIDVSLVNSQKKMLQIWSEEYRGDLGIALTDTIGIDAFLKDFDLYFAKLYDGVRHDSGCPFIWGDKVIKHYNELGIDPMTKYGMF